MAYIPPHKRHSKDTEKPIPAPASLVPQFHQSLSLGSQRRRDRPSSSQQAGKISYATGSISQWWPVGSADVGDDPIPASFRLEPVERKTGQKRQVLSSGGNPPTGESTCVEEPWVTIAERIEPLLRASVERLWEDMESEAEAEEIKMSFVARVGKVHFYGDVCLDSIRKAACAEADSRNQVRKSFSTNVPSAYMEDIHHLVVPKIELDFESEKERYNVKVFDKYRPHSTISCKCTLSGDGSKLEIYKIELNPVRHLVVDLSCLHKDLDLRLMLVTKKILSTPDLQDEEKDGIDKLIEHAILDPDVKGRLRWPLGKDSVAERFSIVGAWHTKCKAFRGPTMRLKLRDADRFDYMTSSGEVSSEVALKLTGVSKKLSNGDLEAEDLKVMLQEAVKLIWDNFLTNNHPSA